MVLAFRSVPWLKPVVFTGGPGGGKTEISIIALDYHKKILKKPAAMVSEAARELIAQGFHPVDPSWKKRIAFQRQVFLSTLEKENRCYEALCEMNLGDEDVALICDRGLLDGLAYLSHEQFGEFLAEFDVTYEDLLERYHCVINLVTSAVGAEEFYRNDKQRHESIADARALETRTRDAWKTHPHIVDIDNSTDFAGKITRSLDALHTLLKIPKSKQTPRAAYLHN